MVHDLVIYGAGGFGKEMLLMVEQMNADRREWNLLGFLDDGKRVGEQVDGLPVLGGIETLHQWKTRLAVVLALAEAKVRRTVVASISNEKVNFPVMLHPKSQCGSPRNKIGRGSIVAAGSVLTTGIQLGDFVIVNLLSTIGHDVSIGGYTSIMPGCNISGMVTIGEGCLVGTGVQVLQNLTIGDNCTIGAGAVVTHPVESDETVVGIPARRK